MARKRRTPSSQEFSSTALDIHNIEEIRINMALLENDIAMKVATKALIAGSRIMVDRLKEATPVKTGLAKRSWKTRVSKLNTPRRNKTRGVWISNRLLSGVVKKRKKNGTPMNDPFWTSFVEHGTKLIRPRYFEKRTFEANAESVTHATLRVLEAGLAEAAAAQGF